MVVISVRKFTDDEVKQLEKMGLEIAFADNSSLDPHGVKSSDEFNQAVYDLPDEIKKKARILISDSFHVTRRMLEECPNLKWVQHPGAGVNTGEFWTDWDLLDRHGVIVTTAKIHAVPIAEMIVAYMLDLTKRMPMFYERKKKHIYHDGQNIAPGILDGRSALLIGTGHIGRELAKKLKLAFNMRIAGINTDGRGLDYFDEMYTLADLGAIVGRYDYVVCTSVLVEATRHMINRDVLRRMKNTAFLINASRGGLIVENELIDALKAGDIAGAALDSFDVEPLPAGSELWDLANVIVTPHVSGGRPGYNSVVFQKFLGNLPCFLKGEYDKMDEVANTKRY